MENEYAKSNGDKKRFRPNREQVRLRNVRRGENVNSQKEEKTKNNRKQRK